MPPWRKGRGLGPFTSAQPAAGPLLSSQLVWPQTTQNSRSLGDPGHANEHLWSVARPLRAADAVRLPTDLGPPTCRTRLALSGVDRYGGGNGASRSKARSTRLPRTRRGCTSGGHPCRLGIDASAAERCFTRRASRPPGSGVGARFKCGARCRRDAAPLRSYGLEYGPGGLARDLAATPPTRGTSPSRQRDQVLVLPVWRLPGNRSAPFSRSTAPSECPRQQGRGFAACRRACPMALRLPHRHPARVWHPERH